MTYSPSILQEIKDRLSIVAYVGEEIPLKKAGNYHKGLCPFHPEKTPSFTVSDDKQMFHCFGCGEGGDLIHYVMQRSGLSFPETVRELAQRAGVELPTDEDPAAAHKAKVQAHERKLLERVNALASEYYQSRLWDDDAGCQARNYLELRGYADKDFLTQHFVGAAEESWDGLVKFFQRRKVPMELAQRAGLIKARPRGDGYFDFFRDRIIFPIRGAKGEIVGFGGRVLPDRGKAEDPKYLNSSDSPIYQKSGSLYGLPLAGNAMRTKDRAIVVEGYLDVLALHQVGLAEAVAPLGTALTDGHVRLMARYTRNVWLTFDGDEAGRRAARRALGVCLPLQLIPRVVILPEGEDPDTIVRQEGAEGFEARLTAASTLFEWIIDDAVRQHGTDTVGHVQVVAAIKPFFAQLRDSIQEARYAERLAMALRLEQGVVLAALRGERSRTAMRGSAQQTSRVARQQTPDEPQRPAERSCLEFILQIPGGMARIAHQLQPSDFRHPTARAIAERCWAIYEEEGELKASTLMAGETDEKMRSVISGLAFGEGKYEEIEDLDQVAGELIDAVRRPQRREQIAQLNAAIAEAETSGAQERVLALVAQKGRLLNRST